MNARPFRSHEYQRGVAAVEFALVSMIFLTLLFGIIEFSRITFYWNAATEATRLGARLAVVCDMNAATIKSRMTDLFPILSADKIDVEYEPGGCPPATCRQVRITIDAPVGLATYIPFFDFTPVLPKFSTTLPRESMRSSFGKAGEEVANPVCL